MDVCPGAGVDVTTAGEGRAGYALTGPGGQRPEHDRIIRGKPGAGEKQPRRSGRRGDGPSPALDNAEIDLDAGIATTADDKLLGMKRWRKGQGGANNGGYHRHFLYRAPHMINRFLKIHGAAVSPQRSSPLLP